MLFHFEQSFCPFLSTSYSLRPASSANTWAVFSNWVVTRYSKMAFLSSVDWPSESIFKILLFIFQLMSI